MDFPNMSEKQETDAMHQLDMVDPDPFLLQFVNNV